MQGKGEETSEKKKKKKKRKSNKSVSNSRAYRGPIEENVKEMKNKGSK